MMDPTEDTQVWSPDDVDAVKRDVEEEDESGAPEDVAWPRTVDGDELREPPFERGEDVTDPEEAATEFEERMHDES